MKKTTEKKFLRGIAMILMVATFTSTNGSFLVWGMSEGDLNFAGNPSQKYQGEVLRQRMPIRGQGVLAQLTAPAVAQAGVVHKAEAKIVETAEAITVDEILQESGQKNRHSIFSDTKTEIVAREVLGDKTVDALNDDLEIDVGNVDNVDNVDKNNNGDVNNGGNVNNNSKNSQQKQPGFFKKIWANFVGLFNKDLKTSILGDMQLSNDSDKWLESNQLKKEKKASAWWDIFNSEEEKTLEEIAEELKQIQLTEDEVREARDEVMGYYEINSSNISESLLLGDKGYKEYRNITDNILMEDSVSEEKYLEDPEKYIKNSVIKVGYYGVLSAKKSEELSKYLENKLPVVKKKLKKEVSSQRYLEILTTQFNGDKKSAINEQQRRLKELEDVEIGNNRNVTVGSNITLDSLLFSYAPSLGKIFTSGNSFIKEVDKGTIGRYATKSGSVIEDLLEHELLHVISVSLNGKSETVLRDLNVGKLFKSATKSKREFSGEYGKYSKYSVVPDEHTGIKLSDLYSGGDYSYQAPPIEEYVRAVGFLKSDLEKYFGKDSNKDATQEQVDSLIECAKSSDCRYKLHQHTLESVKILKKEKIPEILNTVADTKEYSLGNGGQEMIADKTGSFVDPSGNPILLASTEELTVRNGIVYNPQTGQVIGLSNSRNEEYQKYKKRAIDDGRKWYNPLTWNIFNTRKDHTPITVEQYAKQVDDNKNFRMYPEFEGGDEGQDGKDGLKMWEQLLNDERDEIKYDRSNSTQQAVNLRAIEKKEGWLASGWDTVTGWFGRDNKVELTDEEIATFDSGAGELLAGIGEDNQGQGDESNFVPSDEYGKYLEDSARGYVGDGSEVAYDGNLKDQALGGLELTNGISPGAQLYEDSSQVSGQVQKLQSQLRELENGGIQVGPNYNSEQKKQQIRDKIYQLQQQGGGSITGINSSVNNVANAGISQDLEAMMNDEELFGFVEDSIVASLPMCPVFSGTTTAIFDSRSSSEPCRSFVDIITAPISELTATARDSAKGIPVIESLTKVITVGVDLITGTINATASIADKLNSGEMTNEGFIEIIDLGVTIIGGSVGGGVSGAAIVGVVPGSVKEATIEYLRGDIDFDRFTVKTSDAWQGMYGDLSDKDKAAKLLLGTAYSIGVGSVVDGIPIPAGAKSSVSAILIKYGGALIDAGTDEEKIEEALLKIQKDIEVDLKNGAEGMIADKVLSSIGLNSSSTVVKLAVQKLQVKQEVKSLIGDVFDGEDMEKALNRSLDNMEINAIKELKDVKKKIENLPEEAQKALKDKLKREIDKKGSDVVRILKEAAELKGDGAVTKYVNKELSQEIDMALEDATHWWRRDDKTITFDIGGKAEEISTRAAKTLSGYLVGGLSNVGAVIAYSNSGDIIVYANKEDSESYLDKSVSVSPELVRISPSGDVITQEERINSELEKMMGDESGLFALGGDTTEKSSKDIDEGATTDLESIKGEIENVKNKLGERINKVCTDASCVIGDSMTVLGEGINNLGFVKYDNMPSGIEDRYFNVANGKVYGKEGDKFVQLFSNAMEVEVTMEEAKLATIKDAKRDALNNKASEYYLNSSQSDAYIKAYLKAGGELTATELAKVSRSTTTQKSAIMSTEIEEEKGFFASFWGGVKDLFSSDENLDNSVAVVGPETVVGANSNVATYENLANSNETYTVLTTKVDEPSYVNMAGDNNTSVAVESMSDKGFEVGCGVMSILPWCDTPVVEKVTTPERNMDYYDPDSFADTGCDGGICDLDTVKPETVVTESVDNRDYNKYDGGTYGEDSLLNDSADNGNLSGPISDIDLADSVNSDIDKYTGASEGVLGNIEGFNVDPRLTDNLTTQGANAPPVELSDQVTGFIGDVLAAGIQTAGNKALMAVAQGVTDPKEIAEIYIEEIGREALYSTGRELFGDNIITTVGTRIADFLATGDSEARYEAVDRAAGGLFGSNSEGGSLGDVNDFLKSEYGDDILGAAVSIIRGGNAEEAGKVLLTSMASRYAQNVTTEFITTGSVDLVKKFVPTDNMTGGLFGDADIMGIGLTDTAAAGIAAGVAIIVGQLIGDGRLDLENVGIAAAEMAANRMASNMATDLLGNGMGFVGAAVVSLAISALNGDLNTTTVAATAASIGTTVALTSALATTTMGSAAASLAAAEAASVAGGSAAGGLMAGGSYAGPIGVAAAVAAMVVTGIFSHFDGPSAAHLRERARITKEAFNPTFNLDSFSGTSMDKVSIAVAQGNLMGARQLITRAIAESSLGKIANVIGLGGVTNSAMKIMMNRLDRLVGASDATTRSFDFEQSVSYENSTMGTLTDRFIALKYKLRNCYIAQDKGCVDSTADEIMKARKRINFKSDEEFRNATKALRNQMAQLNKQLASLTAQLAQAKSAAEAAAIQEQINAVSNQRRGVGRQLQNINRGRDQYFEVVNERPKTDQDRCRETNGLWDYIGGYCNYGMGNEVEGYESPR